ncbi:hypothetical protein KIH41_17180 [Litoribacter ruber]|uniref:hypothetical protein n=1 Tax=Litoribacter ruber TaxID=702568 RepID=UPI001BDA46E5|nr:hypothetical protein [Litoribacter ruber]MBT0813024.1 hypothetical protein [Litoribacter ruber]
MELQLKLVFHKNLTQEELENFVDGFIVKIESLGLWAGGGYSPSHINYVLDCSDSVFGISEIKKDLYDFLNESKKGVFEFNLEELKISEL